IADVKQIAEVRLLAPLVDEPVIRKSGTPDLHHGEAVAWATSLSGINADDEWASRKLVPCKRRKVFGLYLPNRSAIGILLPQGLEIRVHRLLLALLDVAFGEPVRTQQFSPPSDPNERARAINCLA